MTIEDLKSAKLSPTTAGYLGVYLKLSSLLGEVSEITERETEREYSPTDVDKVNDGFNKAIYGALDEIMKLAADSIADKICTMDNKAEI